jgi:nucleolar complex protein 3
VLDFVEDLLARDPNLETLLSTEERTFDGLYRPDIDDPQLCNPFGTSFWELFVLLQNHWDPRVRDAAKKLANFRKS